MKFDISQPTNYLQRQMFLDPAGEVTVQRFDVVRYPKLQKYERVARGYFWVPEEIDLSKDKLDMRNASPAVRHMFTSNLLRQTVLDSIQGRTPLQVFGPVCSLPELEALLSNWGFFETNIHSNSYSHIIRNLYNDPAEIFDRIHEIKEVVQMAKDIGVYYERLYELGTRTDNRERREEEIIDAIWLALHASYALEAIRFMVSFATSLAMMENRIFIGNGNIINLILQDELLHTEWTGYIINTIVKDDPRFAAAQERLKDEVMSIYERVIQQEKDWASYLCKEGVVIGLNEKILSSFVDWVANEKLRDIKLVWKPDTLPKSHPIPWFLKHVNLETKQTALQESESTSYVIGALTDHIDKDQLPEL